MLSVTLMSVLPIRLNVNYITIPVNGISDSLINTYHCVYYCASCVLASKQAFSMADLWKHSPGEQKHVAFSEKNK